jgi:hypothetical protein
MGSDIPLEDLADAPLTKWWRSTSPGMSSVDTTNPLIGRTRKTLHIHGEFPTILSPSLIFRRSQDGDTVPGQYFSRLSKSWKIRTDWETITDQRRLGTDGQTSKVTLGQKAHMNGRPGDFQMKPALQQCCAYMASSLWPMLNGKEWYQVSAMTTTGWRGCRTLCYYLSLLRQLYITEYQRAGGNLILTALERVWGQGCNMVNSNGQLLDLCPHVADSRERSVSPPLS